MSALKDFQNQHGREWAEIVSLPAFGAALALAQSEKLREVIGLTDEQIALHGANLIADLRGFLQYESGLLGLHQKKDLVFSDPDTEPQYPSPEAEALAQHLEEEQIASGAKEDDELTLKQRELLGPTQKVVSPKPKKYKRRKPK